MPTRSRGTHRKSLRLADYDYAQVGAYFVTIVIDQRRCLFGTVADEKLLLNTFGCMAQAAWAELPKHFPQCELDAFVVMPNHIHGIVHIAVGAQHAAPLHDTGSSRPRVKAGSLGAIVRSFKSAVTKHYNEKCAAPGSVLWQRNYYEHVIRDEVSLQRIQEYITTNPARWSVDSENPYATSPEPADIWRNSHPAAVGAQHAAPLQGDNRRGSIANAYFSK